MPPAIYPPPTFDHTATSLMETREALDLFRTILLEKLGIRVPIVLLKMIPQWQGFLKSLGVETGALSQLPTQLLGGYFINFSTPVPAPDDVRQTIAESGAKQFVVPTVRAEYTGLLDLGFVALPAYIESAIFLQGSLEATLRNGISARRYLDLRRITRNAEKDYEIQFYEQAELLANPDLIDVAARLHEHNVEKYGHSINIYDAASLNLILHSPLGRHLVVGITRERNTQTPVQVLIALLDSERQDLFFLVQGIDRKTVSTDVNLYSASYLQLYRFAETRSVQRIFLARGKHLEKKRLGANQFFVLNNWIRTESDACLAELAKLRRLAVASQQATLRLLQKETP
jgi:hypothetical protein